MVKAAYRIHDDAGRFPPTSADDARVPHVIAAHALLRYAHNLEMLHDNLNPFGINLDRDTPLQ